MGTEPVVDEEQSEVEVKWGDKSARAKSKYLAEWIAIVCLALLVGGLVIGYQHMLDTREGNKAFIEQMKERNAEITAVFKEMNQAQRDMVAAQREQNCLIALPQDARMERAQLCRRIGQ